MRNKILLVEDSKAIQQMYKNKLTIEQFKVITADNGMEAIKILSQEKPDIILIDLMMPIMDGYKVLQVIKTDPRLSNIPVLVFRGMHLTPLVGTHEQIFLPKGSSVVENCLKYR